MKYFYFYVFLLIVIILVVSYINTYLHDKYFVKENFTPRIREMYRPYVRHTRIYTNNMYNKHKNNIYNFMRKIGFL